MPIPKDPIKAQLWRERQSASQRGRSKNVGVDNPFYGKHHSDEIKQRLSDVLTGEGNAMYGTKRPQYVIDAVRKAHEGKPSAFKGKIHTDEAKRKCSEANKGKISSRRGIPRTPEERFKISESVKKTAPRGEANFMWKGGVTSENMKARKSFEYQEWRRKVYERDNYTCQHCGDNKGGNLNPHHIKSFAEYPELRYVVENGITLCESCHISAHRKKE
jgi:hypothetical protein